MSNLNVLDIHMDLTERAHVLAERLLNSHIKNHFSVPAHMVNWSHVGTAGKVCEDLQLLLDFLDGNK